MDGAGKIGGAGRIVEIDETHLATRKYNVGRVNTSQHEWCFAGICRETHETFLARVANRDADTLIPLLRRFVHPDSLIISDGWRAYTPNINAANGFPNYQWVNHSVEFVNHLDDSIHTQTIERFNSHLKQGVTCFDPQNQNLDLQIYSVCYKYERWGRGRNMISVMERMLRLCEDINLIYPGNRAERPMVPNWIHVSPVTEHGVTRPILWPPTAPHTLTPVEGINVEGEEYHQPLVPFEGVPPGQDAQLQVINDVVIGWAAN